MNTPLAEKAREFFEPREGTGPHAVWLQWILLLESDDPRAHKARTRAKSRIITVMNMKGSPEDNIEFLVGADRKKREATEMRRNKAIATRRTPQPRQRRKGRGKKR
jgi:hypothetical protein